jgi:SAM-dependent methyltransferase
MDRVWFTECAILFMDATLYDQLHRIEHTHWWFRARRHIVWSLVRRYIDGNPNRRLQVCELGCGTGGNLAAIADEHDVVGIECSSKALAYARQTLGSRVRFGSLPHEIDLPPASFDVVLLTDVLEHIDDDVSAARTALTLLRPGGIVVATVPAYQWLYSPHDAQHHHFRRYSKPRFRSLWAVPHCSSLLLSHYNSLLFAPAAAVRLMAKLRSPQQATSGLQVPPQLMNGLLAKVMRSEANLIGRVPIPFGLSLVSVTRKLRAPAPMLPAA